MPLQFTTEARDAQTSARAGRIVTAHGVIETPVFMPVGTKGTLKSLAPAAAGLSMRTRKRTTTSRSEN